MFTVDESGSFGKIESWLTKAKTFDTTADVKKLGQQMISNLEPVTPVDTGLTANSWGYNVKASKGGAVLTITNSSENGFNVVQALRHGHGTGTGGYIPPNDFVSPAVSPLIDSATNLIVRRLVE